MFGQVDSWEGQLGEDVNDNCSSGSSHPSRYSQLNNHSTDTRRQQPHILFARDGHYSTGLNHTSSNVMIYN